MSDINITGTFIYHNSSIIEEPSARGLLEPPESLLNWILLYFAVEFIEAFLQK